MLYDDATPKGILTFDTLTRLVEAKTIDLPRLTKADIQDRGKGDALSKGLVVVQTTWFILQCIARWIQHLPVTELELVTLAFAALNGVMCFLWWDKPLDVRRSFPIYLKKERDPSERYLLRRSMKEFLEGGQYQDQGSADGKKASVVNDLHAGENPGKRHVTFCTIHHQSVLQKARRRHLQGWKRKYQQATLLILSEVCTTPSILLSLSYQVGHRFPKRMLKSLQSITTQSSQAANQTRTACQTPKGLLVPFR